MRNVTKIDVHKQFEYMIMSMIKTILHLFEDTSESDIWKLPSVVVLVYTLPSRSKRPKKNNAFSKAATSVCACLFRLPLQF